MKKYIFLFGFLGVLLTSNNIFADDVLAPSWRGDPSSVYGIWDSFGNQFADESNAWDVGLDWPYFEALFFQILDEYEGRTNVANIPMDLYMNFFIDNYDIPNPQKLVRVQVTYYRISGGIGGAYPQHFFVNSPEGNSDAPAVPVEEYDWGGGWITAAYDFSIFPNPTEEEISIMFESLPSGAYIDQVVIDTKCVPIPGALWLLGSGLVCLVGVRKKLKK